MPVRRRRDIAGFRRLVWLALVTGLAGGLAANRLAALQDWPADLSWHRPLEGLYGDRVRSLVFVGEMIQGTRSMLLLSEGRGLYRLRPDSRGWDGVNVAGVARPDLVLSLAPKLDDLQQRTLFAGLGKPLPLFARSEDYGVTWKTFPGPSGPLRLDLLTASRSGRIYAAEEDNQITIWTSNDAGVTWEQHAVFPSGRPIRALAAAPDEAWVYALVGATIYRTNDRPAQWTPVLGPSTPTSATVYFVAPGRRGQLAAVAFLDEQFTVLSSADRGTTWPVRGWPVGPLVVPSALAVGEVDGVFTIWVGLLNGRIYRSSDGGATWELEGRLSLPPRLIVLDEATGDLWAGSDGLGLYRLRPEFVHTGATPVEALAVVAVENGDGPLVLLNARIRAEQRGLLGDVEPARHAVYASRDGSTWARKVVTTGLGANLLASPAFERDGRLYSGRLVSTDGGAQWSLMAEAPGGGVPYVLAVGPITGTRPVVYGVLTPYQDGAGGSGLFRSEYGGSRWEPTEGPQNGIVAAVVSPNYARDRTAYVATDLGFVYETLNGRDFLQVGRVPSAGPVRNLYALAISANFANDRTLLAVVDDPSQPSNRAHVYISTRAGRGIWQDRSRGLDPTARLRSLELSPSFSLDGVSFAGATTDGSLPAVYAATGDQWFGELWAGAAQVHDLAISGSISEGRLFAAAGTAGVWVRALAGPPEPQPSPTATGRASQTPTASPTGSPSAVTPTETLEPGSMTATATVTATPSPEASATLTATAPTSQATETERPSITPTSPGGRRLYLPILTRPR